MIRRIVNMALALGVLAALPAGAQDAKQTVETAPPKPAPYLLAGDDVLNINVVNFTNLSGQVVVPPDGKISVPLLEPIDVTGKTTQEVAALLTEQWKRFVVKPVVSVSLSQKRKDNVLVYGYVVRPGAADFKPPIHVLEAIAQVGGALPNADLAHVTVTRRTGSKLVLDLSKPETKSGTDKDILLEIGDAVYIPERRTQFTVVGEVEKPGSFDYRDEMDVAQALTEAGGVKETADLAAAKLIHNGQESPLNLEAFFRKGDFKVNVKVAAGDTILVPEIKNRVYVFGEVAKPGYYLYKQDDRVLDALNGCGGPLREAGINKINVIRVDRAKGEAKMHTVDIEKFLKKADAAANIPLEPGDVLYVPGKKSGIGIRDLFGMLTGINAIGTTYRIIEGRYY